MPAFPNLPEATLDAIAGSVMRMGAPASQNPAAGDVAAGQLFFSTHGCFDCHMINGRGGTVGPDLSSLGTERRLTQIETSLGGPGKSRLANITLSDGSTVRAVIRHDSGYDLLLQELNGRFRSIPKNEARKRTDDPAPLMPAVQASPQEMRDLLAYLSRLTGVPVGPVKGTPIAPALMESGDWPSYNGDWSGNRYSALDSINTSNVARLAPRWMFPVGDAKRLQGTPVVAGGVMYVTTANQAYALDARTGQQIWHYARPLTKGVIGDAAGGINRGAAVLGDRLFMVTDNAHLISLHRTTGALLWDVEMADYREHYGATSAPLIVKNLVISGTSGGDEGARGFIDAYRADTGKRAWRVWTMPKRGDPLASTWVGRAIEHGCATAWLTGSYDPEANLIYWTTGNPCPDYNGDERKGDNLFSDSVLAIEPETGKIRWHFQYTPHDLHDWDAVQTPVLADANFRGTPRKLLMQANRNGFFYVLDRITGEFLLGEPFVKRLTWASGIGPNGRPILVPGAEPVAQGVKVCPSVVGATNWMSAAFHPGTGLFYVMALESCGVYTKSSAWWVRGESFYGGTTLNAPGEAQHKFLRAIDVQSGKIIWERPQSGKGQTWGGVLATAGGLVFFCDDSGAFAAVSAADGQPLWHFNAGAAWHASPMTYSVNAHQFVAVAVGGNVVAFDLGG